jgi:4-hydroxyproline epimerase
MKRIAVIDSHTGGEPTRVVLDGVLADELQTYRRAILCEPRGSEVLVGALLHEANDPECAASVTFFNNVGLLGMCGHGMIGVVATLRHLGRLAAGVHRIQTPAGVVTATLREDGRVSVENVLSHRRAAAVCAGGVTGDVAYGGNWFFLVADHGLELTPANIPQLVQACRELRRAVNRCGFPEVDHVELFGPPGDPANHSRNFTLCPGGQFDRSPCGTGTSAKLACLAADGKLAPGAIWRQESVIGSVFEACYRSAPEGVLATITGRAYITAEAQIVLDPADPFRLGIDFGSGGAGSQQSQAAESCRSGRVECR